MNDNRNMTSGNPGFVEAGRRAYPSSYLDRKSATLLMVIKLAEGLSKLCIAILAGFMLQTVLTALNRIFQQGTTVSDGKAMVAQVLKTIRVPAETIQQIVDAFPLDITFSSRPVLYVFVISLPFVLIAVLEAIAVIRLRFGKGGTRTIGVLQMIYFVLGSIRVIVVALVAVALSLFTIVRLGGTPGIMLSTIYISLAVFYIVINLPTLLYHKNIAGLMEEVRYELDTGKRSVRIQPHFKIILKILIVLEVLGALVSFLASWNPQQSGFFVALFVVTMIGPAAKLLKYLCVMCCYQNYMQEEDEEEEERSISHVPQIVLIILVTLLFAVPNVLLCMQSTAFSDAVVEKVEEFFSNARETVDEVSVQAEAQIEAVESAIASQTGAIESAASSKGDAASLQGAAKEDAASAAASSQGAVKEEAAGDAASSQGAAKEETAGAAAPTQGTAKEETAGAAAPTQGTAKKETTGDAAS